MTTEIQPVLPQLEFLMQVTVTLEPALEIGDTAAGIRRGINITGGYFRGPKLTGQVLPDGADWQLARADGVAGLEACYTLQTDDGALIFVQNRGLRHDPIANVTLSL